MNRNRFMLSTAVFHAPENEGGGGDGEVTKEPGSVLFPNENDPPKGEGEGGKKEGTEGEGAGEGEGDKGGDWKEYEPDAAKSAEENAAAKAEHDKTKPAELTDDEKAAKEADRIANEVPADGKYQLTMPEGLQGIDQELLDAVGPKLAAAKLTNKQAQELTDEYIKTGKAKAEKEYADWVKTQETWVTEAKADKDIGGDKWDSSVKDAHRAVLTFGDDKLKEYLNTSGGGNHPSLIKFFAKVGKLVKDDQPPGGGTGGGSGAVVREPAHALFPDDAPKG